MALLEKPEVRDLLTAARATRNYCMLTGRGRDKSDQLIDALSPFDGNPNQIKSSHLVALRKAMRDICRDIDEYTLTRILDGDPPVRIGPAPIKPREGENRTKPMSLVQDVFGRFKIVWPKVWQRIMLPGIAIVLLLLAMHYTHWSFNANLILNRLDDHMAIDVHEEIRDLIVVARAIETNEQNGDGLGAGTPAQKLFNQTMSRLKAYHYQEESLRTDSINAASRFDAMLAAQAFVGGIPARLFAPDLSNYPPPPSDTQLIDVEAETPLRSDLGIGDFPTTAATIVESMDKIDRATDEQISQANIIAQAATPLEPEQASIDGMSEDVEIMRLVHIALAGHDGFHDIVRVIAEETGRNPASNAADHVVTRLQLLQTAEELKDKISRANRFALPMIYGSLGAALFCLVRVLTPALSDLGPARAFLRILFGSFAAMTLSMLFIPANVFTINDQSNPTLIFLACFLFGYSFDAVLSALHRLEAFLQGRLQPQEGN